ncbi:hypothetical protein Bbelb_040200 [Branchiostoma belcheri]|nr:hypothetical protein Bbelb_040200 [Branchiostoma belcheri]
MGIVSNKLQSTSPWFRSVYKDNISSATYTTVTPTFSMEPFTNTNHTKGSLPITTTTSVPTTGIDKCEVKPCKHDRCGNKDVGYNCTCLPGWTGHDCENDVDECKENPCKHGRCVNKDGGYNCTCSPEWTGHDCEHDVDECKENPCKHGRCVNKDGGYKCTCSPAWTGHDCENDVNVCKENPCKHGRCVNKDGGYNCTCSPGWTGHDCENDVNECKEKPCKHGRCVNKDGGYKCTCSPGWTGHDCENDVNECQEKPCKHGRCVNKDGGYSCICSPGWTGHDCENDVNECQEKPCKHGLCVNKDGGYSCICSPGWTGHDCENDVNECKEKPCKHGRCVNKDGGYNCTCSPGWTGHDCENDVDTRTVYACKYGTVQLSCVDGETLLIMAANYGRTSTLYSGCGCWITCRTDCRSVNSLAVVRATCQGNEQCTVLAKNDVFGDPCPGLQKYLEVSYRCITETNVALFKTASSSSTGARWGPEKAVDGFRGTSVNRGQCTHTNNVYQPWWKVDLADTYTVNRVSVLNRGDCCGGRLKGFMVRIGLNKDFTRNDQCGETYTAKPSNGATVVVYCDHPMAGRYVSIQLIGRSGNLQLCEVDVFAETADGYRCPSGWHRNGNHCYKLSERVDNWSNAKKECQKDNSHLLSITNADESKFIERLISNDNQALPLASRDCHDHHHCIYVYQNNQSRSPHWATARKEWRQRTSLARHSHGCARCKSVVCTLRLAVSGCVHCTLRKWIRKEAVLTRASSARHVRGTHVARTPTHGW